MQQIKIKIIPKKYTGRYAIKNVINYILDPSKRGKDNIYGTLGVFASADDTENLIKEFRLPSRLFKKNYGPQIKHLVVAFDKRPNLTNKEIHCRIRKNLSYWSQNHLVVYSVHENTDNWHFHFALSGVRMDSKKINITRKEQIKFKKYTKRIWGAKRVDFTTDAIC